MPPPWARAVLNEGVVFGQQNREHSLADVLECIHVLYSIMEAVDDFLALRVGASCIIQARTTPMSESTCIPSERHHRLLTLDAIVQLAASL